MILEGKKIEEEAKANAEKMRRGEWPDPSPTYVKAQEEIEALLTGKPEKKD